MIRKAKVKMYDPDNGDTMIDAAVHQITERGTFIVEYESGYCDEVQAKDVIFLEPEPEIKIPQDRAVYIEALLGDIAHRMDTIILKLT